MFLLAMMVMVSMSETVIFTLDMGPFTFPSCGLWKAGVWSTREKITF